MSMLTLEETTMPANDPVMAVVDKLPLTSSPDTTSDTGTVERLHPELFGLRFAVSPTTPVTPRDDKHKKTYYTVTVKEATRVSRDGRVETIDDEVQRERED